MTNHAPVVSLPSGPTVTATSHGQVIQLSALFNATDADNDPLTYYVYNYTSGPNSGHWAINGVALPSGQWDVVTQAQLAQTTFVAGANGNSDDLLLLADDGQAQGGGYVHLIDAINHKPVVSDPGGGTYTPAPAQVTQASTLFTPVDADNDPLTYYFYQYNTAANGGHWQLNGVNQTGGQWHQITQAQLGQLTFVAGQSGTTNQIILGADDGSSEGYNTVVVNSSGVNALPSTPTDTNAGANSVAEAATAGTLTGVTAHSTDPYGLTLTYSLTGDSSGGGFTINAATGVITVADPAKIDYETSPGHAYTVTAQASDGTLSSSQTFTIAVTDVPLTTPIDTDAAADSVLEGAAAGTAVGITASATDPNGPAPTYSLTGDTSGGGFTINSTTGVVTVADPIKLDYETTNPGHTYTVTVQASNGITTTQNFTIVVTDAPPSTPVDSDAGANTVAEGAANGSTVGVTVSSADPNGPAVTYSLTSDTSNHGFTINATTGVITVADATKIDYETSGGSYTVTSQASDGTLTNSQTFTIDVTDVAPSTPVDTDASANSVTVGAPAGTTVGITAASSDVNGPAVSYSLTGDTSGGGFTIDATTGVVTVADPAKILPGDPSYNITINSSDGTDLSPQTFTITVITDAPPVVTPGNTLNYTENQAATAIDTTVTVTDSDTANLAHATVQITGGYVNGEDVLAFVNTASITGVFDALTGTMTLTGSDTVAHYQAALRAVTYHNTSDDPSGAARTVTFIANDGTFDSSAVTDTINVTAVNDAPVNAVPGAQAVNEDTDLVFSTGNANTIAISDVDVESGDETVTLTVTSGTLALGSNLNLTSFTNNAASITLTGTVAHINTALDGLTYHGNLNFNGSDSLSVVTDDGGNTGSGGPKTDTDNVAITVTAVNDAPVNSVPGAQSVNEDTNLVFSAGNSNAITISDVDANGGNETVTLTVVSGVLALGSTLNLVSFTNNSASITLTGTVAHINTALDGLTYHGNLNFNGSDSLSVVTNDNNNTGSGGPQTDTDNVAITVNPVNDPPVNSVPATQTVLEDTNLVFSSGNANAISISDVDVLAGNETVTLTVANGALTLNGIAGLSFTTGDGTADSTMTFSGTVAAIDTALNGLIYRGGQDFNGSDSLSITTNDNGNTGLGGAKTDTDSVTINITPVNDAPSFVDGPNQSVTEDSGAHSVTNFATSLSAGPANESGQLLNFIVSNNNNAMFSAQPTISSNGTLTYTTAANYSGTATVTVQIHDNGGTANGGVDTSAAQTFVINASPVADTPTFTTALTPVAATSETQVNTNTAGDQNSAAITALLNGGYVVAWQDTNLQVTEGRIYNANGTPATNGVNGNTFDFTIDDANAASAANTLSLNELPNGGFLMTDVRQDLNSGDAFIEGYILTSTGVIAGPGSAFFQVSPIEDNNLLEVTRSSASVFSDGSFVVTWEDVLSNGNATVNAQRFKADGSAIHQNGTTLGLANFQVSQAAAGVSQLPDIAALTNGNFVITWDFSSTNAVGTRDVFYQVYNSAGAAVGGVTEANTTTANDQNTASVTALSGGGFAIVWTSDNQVSGSSEQDIYFRLFNASGTATTGEILANTTTVGVEDTSNITALPDGGFLVSWDSDQDAGSGGVFAQRFDASGNKVGNEFLINLASGGSAQQQHTPSDHDPQAVLNNGTLVAAWDSNQNGAGNDIFTRQFTVPGDGGENAAGIGLGAITALVTDLVGTTLTNGGHEIIDHLTLSGFSAGTTFSLGHAGAGNTWVIDQAADITAIQSSGTQLKLIPTAGFTGSFTLDVTATVTDSATLSTGNVTDTLTTAALHIPIGVKAPGDPVFAADSAGPFDLHLDPVAQGDTVTINALPGNGQLEYGDGSVVADGAVLSAAQFAALKFAPMDVGTDTQADFQFTVSDGTTDTLNTVPITLIHGTGVTINGSIGNDHLIGSPGNDTLNGGPGFDMLTGGAGADHFVFDQNALTDATSANPSVDHVTDYSAAQGDTIDVSALFTNLSSAALANPSSLVHATEDVSGTFSTIQVNTAAAGQPAVWVNIAQLDGVKPGDAVDVIIDSTHSAVQVESAFAALAQAGPSMKPMVDLGPDQATPSMHPMTDPGPSFAYGGAASLVSGIASAVLGAGIGGLPSVESLIASHLAQNHVDLNV